MDRGYFEDLLGQLEPLALAMDRTGDTANVHLLFRLVHNLKSSVAQEGQVALATEVHHLEDTLDRIRRGRATWQTDTCDLVMAVIDRVRATLDGPGEPEGTAGPEPARPEATQASAPPPPEEVFENPLADPMGPATPDLPRPSPTWGLALTQLEADGASLATALGQGLYRIEKLFRRGLSRETFNALPVLEDIRELGTLIAQDPPWEAYDAGPEEQIVKFLFASTRTGAELEAILFDPLIVIQPPAALQTRPRTALRMLVMEDNPTVAGLLNYILSKHGECAVCEAGTEGLAYFRACWDRGEPLDLIVLDLCLPDLDGDEVLRAIRRDDAARGLRPPNHHCLVLMNTASLDLDRMKAALIMEPDGYLLKPINMDLVLELVEDLKAKRLTPAR